MTAESTSELEPIDILLIEPNPGDARLFSESLTEGNLINTVHTVTNGGSALEYLCQRGEHANQPKPDLLLLEPRLPDTDGVELLQELQEESVLKDLPVVVLTSSTVGEEIVRSHGLEADCFVQKPIEPADFLEFATEIEDFWVALVQT